jgi:phosphoglycolate phosphatase
VSGDGGAAAERPAGTTERAAAPDLLFDLDGTLTDNFTGIAASIRHALARLSIEAPDDASLRHCVGPPLRATFARLLGTGDAALVERAIVHYRERFADVGWRENVPYPGIDEALAVLHDAGARLWVCTAKPQVYAERIVTHFGLALHFAGVYGADMAGRFDDKSTLMAHLLAQEKVPAASATMIGDRGHDIRAARGNAVRAVAVRWGYGSAAELAEADAHVDVPGDLPAVLLAAR